MVSSLKIQNLFFILFGFYLVVKCDIIERNEDICGIHNGRRLYLELGEKGILHANNVSFVKNEPRQDSPHLYVTNSSHDQCSLELVTCPSCAITVTFKSLALPHTCNDNGVVMDSPCRCDYVWISEPPYEDISGTPYCGLYAPLTYRSNTRTVSITLLYSKSHEHAFTLEYTSERNKVYLRSWEPINSKGINSTAGGILTSPFFPARYPRDLGIEYIITCPAEVTSCRIRILFSDFQLATVSIIEFYDWNGQRLDVSSGARFRPPIIVSTGPTLLIRFYANGGTGLGYKAFYSYILGNKYDKSIQPITDCGGYVENLGGTITMMDMVVHGLKTYDCVWLIRPPKNFLHTNTHMYVKVVTFSDMGNTELIIRQGPTSALLPLEVIRHPANQLQPQRMNEHVAPISSGFHVSLRGTFGVNSRVAIAYAAFGYIDCFSGTDFLCQNHRCIQSQLNCDGFDHCGDNSDEPSSCFRDWDTEPRDGKWHTNKANYYFPKIDRYPDLKTATLVFVASSLGLIILISALIVLLYRMGSRSRQQRELHSRLQTISELLDRTVFDIADSGRIDEITVHDEPPVYEAPPGYDEVIKLGFDSEVIRKKRKRREPRQDIQNHLLSQRPQDLSIASNLIVDLIGSSRNRDLPSAVVAAASDSNMALPQSPPPPYITPSSSVLENFGVICRRTITHTSVPISLRGDRLRRNWRQSSEHRRSFPGSEDSNFMYLNASVDFEAIGSYFRNYTPRGNSAIRGIDSPPSPNLASVHDVNSNTMLDPIVDITNLEAPGTSAPNYQPGSSHSCTCQGACGCANQVQITEIPTAENDPKQTIIKLFKSSKSAWQNFGNTTVTPMSFTESAQSGTSTQRESESACSEDNINYSRNTSVSSCDSRDVFDIVSMDNMSNLSSSSTLTPIRSSRSAIDLLKHGNDKIYEPLDRYDLDYDRERFHGSLKILDNFLARRNANEEQMNSAATITVFGTPLFRGRQSRRNYQSGLFHCLRGWKSSDDTFLS